MELAYKPDFAAAKWRWAAFWEHEIIDRPLCWVQAPLDGAAQAPHPAYLAGWNDDFAEAAQQYDAYAAGTYFAGESIPIFTPSFGPEMFGAWIGADLERSEHSKDATSWAVPFVEDWREELPIRFDPNNTWWRRTLEFVTTAAHIGRGKFLVSMLDTHSNADGLASIREPALLCMDFLDTPELMHQAMRDVRAVYEPTYDALWKAAYGPEYGSAGWLPYYCEGKFGTTQCDFAIMVSPALFNEFFLPALEEEWAYLDHSAYHYDGPGALVHLDSILAAKDLDSIQWTPGSGAKPFIEWMDLLKVMQAAGKSLYIPTGPEEIKIYHRELKPELCCYQLSCSSQKEADDTLKWLVDHT